MLVKQVKVQVQTGILWSMFSS